MTSVEISTSFLLFPWNLYFLTIFKLKPLLSLEISTFYLSIEISSGFLLLYPLDFSNKTSFNFTFYWHLYFLFTFQLKSLLFLYFSGSWLFYWNLYCLFTFLLKPLLPLSFCIEISSFSLLSSWDLYPCARLHQIYSSISLRKDNHAMLPTMQLRTTCAPAALHCGKQSFLAPPTSSSAPKPRCNRATSQTTSFRDRARSDLLWKHTDSHASLLSNLHIAPRLPLKLPPLTWATSWLSLLSAWATPWPSYSIVSYTSWWLYLLTALFSGELPLDYSTSWLSCPIVRNYGSF